MYNSIFRLKGRWLLLFLVAALLNAAGAFAQGGLRVTGSVTAKSDGTTLPGVSVRLKGSTVGTSTDPSGKFSINLPSAGTLVFSFIGFTAQEVPVSSSTNLTVVLEEASAALNEVVVVGYGTTRRKDLTGSIAVVNERDFQRGNITTPEQMIAGKVPGVSITSNSGQPGAGSTIRIRGGASISASNDPLIVIDGVPLDESRTKEGRGSISGASDPLSFINPNDIESFTVLKDASAAAIYGARASNGVIIITTKKGNSNAFKVGFNSVNSISDVIRTVDVLTADELRAVVNVKGASSGFNTKLGTESINWQDQIFQSGLATDNNVSFSGGVKNLPYRLSLGYQNQTGILKTDEYQKTSLAVALNPRFFDNHLKVDLNLKGSMQKTRFANTDAIGSAISFDPTHPIRSGSDQYNGYFEYLDPAQPSGLANLVLRNPAGLLNQHINRGTPKRSIGNLQIDYSFHFLPELHANLNLGYDVAEGQGTTFVEQFAAFEFNRQGINNQYKRNRNNTLADFYLNYVKEFKSIKSRVDVTGGYSYNDYQTTIYNYPDVNVAGTVLFTPNVAFDKPQNRLVSYFARANYSFDDRYMLTATFRRDGSSKFGPEYKYGNFPSVALAWTVKNERFLKNTDALSALKVRLGYGVTGQQGGAGIGNYDYLSYYALSSPNALYQFGNTFYEMYRPAGYFPKRKWEETATTNLGIDFGFLNNRISGSIDLYDRKTNDLLIDIPQPAGTNFSATIVANAADMTNRGLELTLLGQPVKNKDFNWDAGFNITFNKNEITNLFAVPNPSAPPIPAFSSTIAGGVGGQTAAVHAVGSPRSTFYLYQQVYDAAGNPLEGIFVDQNNDGVINQNDRVKSKSSDPKVFLGFTNNLSYRKWNAGFVMRANFGNYVYDNVNSQSGSYGNIAGNAVLYNAARSYLTTRFEGTDGNQLLSDYFLHNASFLRMDNINIGYNAGQLFSKANLRLSATVQNVFVISKYKGLDPEISNGLDNNFYPRPRTFSLGLNLSY